MRPVYLENFTLMCIAAFPEAFESATVRILIWLLSLPPPVLVLSADGRRIFELVFPMMSI